MDNLTDADSRDWHDAECKIIVVYGDELMYMVDWAEVPDECGLDRVFRHTRDK